jgi:hypothetical protein
MAILRSEVAMTAPATISEGSAGATAASAAMSQEAEEAGSAPTADGVKILIDSPSKNPSLGFEATASALAQIIRDSPPRFAVGIFGDWGSGRRPSWTKSGASSTRQ